MTSSDEQDLPPADLPKAWRDRLAGYSWRRQARGCSSAAVFRLASVCGGDLFVKAEPATPWAELPDEIERLCWLQEQGVPCPAAVDMSLAGGNHWLLMSAVPGEVLANFSLEGARVIELAAKALRDLHRQDAASCPFDNSLDRRIAQARARVDAGLVDEGDFDEDYRGWTARELLAELESRRPDREERKVTHGDACLTNMLATNEGFSGFIDCGRLGVADPHQDFSLLARSIGGALGCKWERVFLNSVPGEVDPERLAFYRLLDEFF